MTAVHTNKELQRAHSKTRDGTREEVTAYGIVIIVGGVPAWLKWLFASPQRVTRAMGLFAFAQR